MNRRGRGKDTEGGRGSKYATWIVGRQHNETQQTLYKKQGEGRKGPGNKMERMSSLKVHCTCVWNYHN
jgi:hypothetical protein